MFLLLIGESHGGFHHWFICWKTEEKSLNPHASTFESHKEGDLKSKASNSVKSFRDVNSTDEIGGFRSRDYAPMVLAEVKSGDGRWVKARCLLDTGSNSSLIRTQFARYNCLSGGNPCYVSFSVAGGGVHSEKTQDWEFELRPMGENKSYFIMATGVKKPCADINSIPPDTLQKYKHLREVENRIYIEGGEIDILIGQDYAPLVVPERVVRAPESPDECPSVALHALAVIYTEVLQEWCLKFLKM